MILTISFDLTLPVPIIASTLSNLRNPKRIYQLILKSWKLCKNRKAILRVWLDWQSSRRTEAPQVIRTFYFEPGLELRPLVCVCVWPHHQSSLLCALSIYLCGGVWDMKLFDAPFDPFFFLIFYTSHSYTKTFKYSNRSNPGHSNLGCFIYTHKQNYLCKMVHSITFYLKSLGTQLWNEP